MQLLWSLSFGAAPSAPSAVRSKQLNTLTISTLAVDPLRPPVLFSLSNRTYLVSSLLLFSSYRLIFWSFWFPHMATTTVHSCQAKGIGCSKAVSWWRSARVGWVVLVMDRCRRGWWGGDKGVMFDNGFLSWWDIHLLPCVLSGPIPRTRFAVSIIDRLPSAY